MNIHSYIPRYIYRLSGPLSQSSLFFRRSRLKEPQIFGLVVGPVLAASAALGAEPLPSMASSPAAAHTGAPGRQQQDEIGASPPAAAVAIAGASLAPPRSDREAAADSYEYKMRLTH
eukprot:COSAG06_NODE_1757_length_8456_cov_13.708867_2_plen_117_part_00